MRFIKKFFLSLQRNFKLEYDEKDLNHHFYIDNTCIKRMQ
jgi:hypothetical protein